MNALLFVPVLPKQIASAKHQFPTELIQPTLPGIAIFALRLRGGSPLVSERIASVASHVNDQCGDSSIVAMLYGVSSGPTPSWMLVACSSCVGHNGQTPALPLAAIELGDLLTIGESCWMVTSLWRPEPVDAPAELRDKPCPVCGGELGFAQVVQCACGRWSHLENPAAPDDPNVLNCFLKAGVCGECFRRASLEPQIIPNVPISLTDAQDDDDE